MAIIRYLKNKLGCIIYPITKTKAVYDDNDNNLDTILNKKVDEDKLVKTLKNKQKPFEKILFYYGYPISISGSWSVDNSINIYKNYDVCVFGNDYNSPSHPTHSYTLEIFRRLKIEAPETKIAGYVPIGLNSGDDSNLSMNELKEKVDLWVNMGVDGIFLDEFGYDYYVTRARQNEIVSYCKSHGLFVFANSWSIEYCFNPNPMTISWIPDFEPNPKGIPAVLDENDYYIYENLFYTSKKKEDGSIDLKYSSVWRIDDIMNYYNSPKIDGKSYYQTYKTKICSLDGIPSTTDITTKNTLQTISVIGAAILNISAVAFGDENWGASGYYHDWDLPPLDLATPCLHGVAIETKNYTTSAGEQSSFPYKWSANLNGHTYSITLDVPDPDGGALIDGLIYASIDGVQITNAWSTIFDFQTDVRNSNELILQIRDEVNNALPTLSQAEERMTELIEDTNTQIDNATSRLEAGLADLGVVVEGFTFKEVQW